MQSRAQIMAFALAVFAAATVSDDPAAAAAALPGRPNIILVMTDDQGLGDFSYLGNPEMLTVTLSPACGTLTPMPSDTSPPGLTDKE